MTEKTPEQEAYERGFQDGWAAAIKFLDERQLLLSPYNRPNFVVPYTPYVPPVTPPIQPYVPTYTPYTPPTTAGCSVCGLNFTGTLGYVCPNFNCPSKVTCSNRNENL